MVGLYLQTVQRRRTSIAFTWIVDGKPSWNRIRGLSRVSNDDVSHKGSFVLTDRGIRGPFYARP